MKREMPPDFDKRGNTSAGLHVADVALDGTHIEGLVRRAACAEDSAEGKRLSGVAGVRTRAVGLGVLHLGGNHAGPLEGFVEQLLLGLVGGEGDAGGSVAAAVAPRRLDGCIDVVVIGECSRQRTDEGNARTLTTRIAVCAA